eukprot:3825660-Pyramimonas_sp.AAC.1
MADFGDCEGLATPSPGTRGRWANGGAGAAGVGALFGASMRMRSASATLPDAEGVAQERLPGPISDPSASPRPSPKRMRPLA